MIKKFQEYFKESMFFPTPKDKIIQLCKKYKIQNYYINPDLSIDVDGGVNLGNLKLASLPLRFSRVRGDFDCSRNLLTTLEGSPREVGGDFNCYSNQLTTLEGSPIEIGEDFNCYYNLLTTLDGGPREVGGDFYCRDNPIDNPVYEILNKFLDHRKEVLKVWSDFNVVRNGNEISAYRFKEMFLDVTGREFKGDLEFEGYKVVE